MVTTTTYPSSAREQSDGSYTYSPPCVIPSKKSETIGDTSAISQIVDGKDQPSMLPPSILRQQRQQEQETMRTGEVPVRNLPREQRETVEDDTSHLEEKSTREPSQALVDEIINNLAGLWHRGEQDQDVAEDDGSESTSSSTTTCNDDIAENHPKAALPNPQDERGKQPRKGFSIIQAGIRALSPARNRVPAAWPERQFPTSLSTVNCLAPNASAALPVPQSREVPSVIPDTVSPPVQSIKSVEAILASIKSVEVKLEELEQQQRRENSSHGECETTSNDRTLQDKVDLQPKRINPLRSLSPAKKVDLQPKRINPLRSLSPTKKVDVQPKRINPLRSLSPTKKMVQPTPTSLNNPKSPPIAVEGNTFSTSTEVPIVTRKETSHLFPTIPAAKTATLESTLDATEAVLDDIEQPPPSLKHRLRTVACWTAKKSTDPSFSLTTPRPKSDGRNPRSTLSRSRSFNKPAVSNTATNKRLAVLQGMSKTRDEGLGSHGKTLTGLPKTVAGPPLMSSTSASSSQPVQFLIPSSKNAMASKPSMIDDKRSTLSTMISTVQSSLSFNSSLDQMSEPMKVLSSDNQFSFPVMRIVSDGFSDTKLLVQGSRDFMIGAPDVMFTPTSGNRQSIILYEYDTGSHAAVVYDEFGDDPRSLLDVEEFKSLPQSRESIHEVLIKVEASTVSRADCAIRQGEWWRASHIPLPNIPGVDIVGRIQRIDKRTAVKFNLREGDRVTAITRWGGNSRYACVPAKLLVKVPGNLDPGKSVCLAETYLSAFQSVHYGQPEGVRYSKDSLAGKVILVVEGYTNVGLAAISLAIHAGAIVYTTAKEKHFQELTRLGAIPLTRDPFDWLPLLGERMDIVIAVGGVYSDAEEPANHYHLRALREGGFLVLVGDPGDQWIPKILSRSAGSIGCAVGMSKADLVSTHKYNVFEQWTDDLEGSKRDLRHLLKLLQNGVFNPKVIDRIPLSRVPKAQELIQDKSHNGIIVCEPWIRSKHRSVLL